MVYIWDMKTRKKAKTVYRGFYVPDAIDKQIRAIADRERRSYTKTAEILLESALMRIHNHVAPPEVRV